MQHAMFSNAVSSKLETSIYVDPVFTVNPSPLCLSISFTVANVLFKHGKSQTKLLTASSCTWLVKQRPLLLNSWLTHLCMRHMVDQKVLYNSYLHSRIWRLLPCQRSCEWGSGSTADLVRRICRNHGHKLKQNKTNKDLDLHGILSRSFLVSVMQGTHFCKHLNCPFSYIGSSKICSQLLFLQIMLLMIDRKSVV